LKFPSSSGGEPQLLKATNFGEFTVDLKWGI
jgi:hypothetical protein